MWAQTKSKDTTQEPLAYWTMKEKVEKHGDESARTVEKSRAAGDWRLETGGYEKQTMALMQCIELSVVFLNLSNCLSCQWEWVTGLMVVGHGARYDVTIQV